MLPQPLMVSVLGAAAVVCFVLGLWLPLIEVERRIKRRLRGFVQAPMAAVNPQLGLIRPAEPTPHSTARHSTPLRMIQRILSEAESTMSPRDLLVVMGILGLVALAATMFFLREVFLAAPAGLLGDRDRRHWLLR